MTWWLLFIILGVYFSIIIPLIISGATSDQISPYTMILGLTLGFLMVNFLIVFNRKNAKNTLETGEELLARDQRKPILFLRSFLDEKNLVFQPLKRLYNYNHKEAYQVKTTFEDLISPYINEHFGPFIALGNPEDTLPSFGASKIYLPEDNWQKRVAELCHQSKFIIVVEALTEGLVWELGYIKNNIPASKLSLLIYPEPFARAQNQWSSFVGSMISLGYQIEPEDPGAGSLIVFDEHWQSSIVKSGMDTIEEMVELLYEQHMMLE
jgi:hypothetical protein